MISRSSRTSLIILGSLTSLAASLASYWTDQGLGVWYLSLAKPSWVPPATVFGPVSTVSYVLLAVAGWRAWQRLGGSKGFWLLYGSQLILYSAWYWLFFAHQLMAATGVLIVSWLLIGTMILLLYRRGVSISAWLLVPYWSWVGFAAAFSLSIARLN